MKAQLDVKGKTCPWPVLLTRQKLNKLNSGDVLEVVADYAPARENVERVAKSLGNKVLEIREEKDQFVIVIEKR
ncbi:MAG: sulfurtransferase TusA family protein [Candidatus Bathyarchaeota archaeon]|nr:sulfurtransferase TusA family protein [Candidatus Bathyarchaeota archaeon]